MIKILIIEEHLLFRESFSKMLNSDTRLQVVGATGSFKEAFSICINNQPDVLIVGTHLSPVDGFMVTEKIKISFPDIRVIGLSAYGLPILVKRFLRLGGSGYITKHASCTECIECVVAVSKGQVYLSEDVKDSFLHEEVMPATESSGWSSLTSRELLILQGVKNGKSSRILAAELGLSSKTVEAHRYRILKKLNLKSSVALVQYANMQGI